MTLEIPVTWLSYERANPARGRWDQMFLDRVLAGEEGHPPHGYRFVDTVWDRNDHRGRVIVFPAGAYHELGTRRGAVTRLWGDLMDLEWAVLIATSDEAQTFDWHKIDPWPDHVTLWVMLPQVAHQYPPRTRFIGEGSPIPARQLVAKERDIDVFYSGQLGHERRDLMWKNLQPMTKLPHLRVQVSHTEAFLRGTDGEQVARPGADFAYVDGLTRSWVVPCPSGIRSQSSFRLYETLEAGAIPIVDALSPDPDGNRGFWAMLGLDKVAPLIESWSDLPVVVDAALVDRYATAAHISSRWQQYKRRLVAQLHDDVRAHVGLEVGCGPHDDITVIIPTSPVPSNPDLSMIQETVASIRSELPGAEILITCDGVRDEQLDMADAYHEYLYRLCRWTATQHNVIPFTHQTHQHQSGMLRHILGEIRTEFLLYVEHDAPLVSTIPFAEIVDTMRRAELNKVRFMHEDQILRSHLHLFMREEETGVADRGPAPWMGTIQWSQRPHLARVDWYRGIMDTYFAEDARTMIEDLMHGVAQVDSYADRMRAVETWKRWRMAVYAPEGSWKRSRHSDGRQGAPKFPMFFAYPGERPPDAPPPGWTE